MTLLELSDLVLGGSIDPSPAREGLRWPLPKERQRTGVLVRIPSPLGEAQIFLKIWVRGLSINYKLPPLTYSPDAAPHARSRVFARDDTSTPRKRGPLTKELSSASETEGGPRAPARCARNPQKNRPEGLLLFSICNVGLFGMHNSEVEFLKRRSWVFASFFQCL